MANDSGRGREGARGRKGARGRGQSYRKLGVIAPVASTASATTPIPSPTPHVPPTFAPTIAPVPPIAPFFRPSSAYVPFRGGRGGAQGRGRGYGRLLINEQVVSTVPVIAPIPPATTPVPPATSVPVVDPSSGPSSSASVPSIGGTHIATDADFPPGYELGACDSNDGKIWLGPDAKFDYFTPGLVEKDIYVIIKGRYSGPWLTWSDVPDDVRKGWLELFQRTALHDHQQTLASTYALGSNYDWELKVLLTLLKIMMQVCFLILK
ncbi:hypothetical protein RIF29_27777 [Crotalaria pallida]|uniref:Uncharacterized protein n=1 Tax=Crotalaria pallida TaxID=3830 RepID=A0AAN9EPP8_CROPI